jgi:hypothetical protein
MRVKENSPCMLFTPFQKEISFLKLIMGKRHKSRERRGAGSIGGVEVEVHVMFEVYGLRFA